LFVLQIIVGETIVRKIVDAETTKRAWDILEKIESNEGINRYTLLNYII